MFAKIRITILKALSLLGFGKDCVEYQSCDDNGSIRIDSIPDLEGPTLILTQAGNVNSRACDPIGEIKERISSYDAWVHIDGAFGLWAAVSSKTCHLFAGFQFINSWVTDGHKWLNTPYDCGIAICRSPHHINATIAIQAPYLKAGERAAPKDMVPEFSRSARGIEVWAGKVLRLLLDTCCHHAREVVRGLERLGFEIPNDVVLNQVVATIPGREDHMEKLTRRVQHTDEAWFGPTHWQNP